MVVNALRHSLLGAACATAALIVLAGPAAASPLGTEYEILFDAACLDGIICDDPRLEGHLASFFDGTELPFDGSVDPLPNDFNDPDTEVGNDLWVVESATPMDATTDLIEILIFGSDDTDVPPADPAGFGPLFLGSPDEFDDILLEITSLFWVGFDGTTVITDVTLLVTFDGINDELGVPIGPFLLTTADFGFFALGSGTEADPLDLFFDLGPELLIIVGDDVSVSATDLHVSFKATHRVDEVPVPAPGALGLVGLGLIAIAALRRRARG